MMCLARRRRPVWVWPCEPTGRDIMGELPSQRPNKFWLHRWLCLCWSLLHLCSSTDGFGLFAFNKPQDWILTFHQASISSRNNAIHLFIPHNIPTHPIIRCFSSPIYGLRTSQTNNAYPPTSAVDSQKSIFGCRIPLLRAKATFKHSVFIWYKPKWVVCLLERSLRRSCIPTYRTSKTTGHGVISRHSKIIATTRTGRRVADGVGLSLAVVTNLLQQRAVMNCIGALEAELATVDNAGISCDSLC